MPLCNIRSLGHVVCSNGDVFSRLKALPEETFEWAPDILRSNYLPRAEIVDRIAVIFQEGASLDSSLKQYRLNVNLPTGSWIIDNLTSSTRICFTFDGYSYMVLHNVLLPRNYGEVMSLKGVFVNGSKSSF